MTVLWAPLVHSVTRGVSVRTGPSVTISMEPACVKRGLRGLIAKRDSVPQVSMALSVTSTAPVIPATLWGKQHISKVTCSFTLTKHWCKLTHTSKWKKPSPNSHSEVWTPLRHVIKLGFNRDLCFIYNFTGAFIVNAVLMFWFRLDTDHGSHYRMKEKRDISYIWNMTEWIDGAQASDFDPAQQRSVETLSRSVSYHCCPIFLSHYVIAATHFLVNAPALKDGQVFTVMRPARLDTMERDACCLAPAPTELTAILSQVLVYVPLGSWWVECTFTTI